MSSFDPAKLARLQAQAGSLRTGSKGTPRRKVVPRAAAVVEDPKLTSALKKLNVQPIAGIEEVLCFNDDGDVLHFPTPKVHAVASQNTYAVYGAPVVKTLNDLTAEQIHFLAPERLAELQQMSRQQQGGLTAAEIPEADEDDVPELVAAVEASSSSTAALETMDCWLDP